jgi:hypothetical protein
MRFACQGYLTLDLSLTQGFIAIGILVIISGAYKSHLVASTDNEIASSYSCLPTVITCNMP